MSVEILPCPFCGQELERTAQKINKTARCVTEGCRGGKMPSVILESSQDVAAWNTRHIPEGYALVPVEPTEAMVDAALAVANDESVHEDNFAQAAYQAMIAAAQANPE